MNEIKWTSSPKIATVMARLAGGAASEKLDGHHPSCAATWATAVTTYSTAKIVEKTLRNGDVSDERKVVNASPSPTAPMLSNGGSAARPGRSPPPFVMPASKASMAAMTTPMLNPFTKDHLISSAVDGVMSHLCHDIGLCGAEGSGSQG